MDECKNCIFNDKITGCGYSGFVQGKCEYKILRAAHCDHIEKDEVRFLDEKKCSEK